MERNEKFYQNLRSRDYVILTLAKFNFFQLYNELERRNLLLNILNLNL